MKSWAIPYADAALVLTLLFAPAPATALFRCGEIVTADKYKYNLEALGGPHSVVTSYTEGSRIFNTTYTVDICAPLKKKGDVKSDEQCPNGSRACAIKRLIRANEGGKPLDTIEHVTALAGELGIHGGGPFDTKISQLGEIDPKSGKEGLQVIFGGGFGYERTVKRKQKVVIDFVCAKDLDGTEGEYEPEDKYESALIKTRADDDKKEDGDDDADKDKDKDKDADEGGGEDENAPSNEVQLGIENKPSLVFDRYGPSDSDSSVDVLHLTWSSKHVCRKDAGNGSDGGDDDKGGEKKPSSHWGAFTWIILLVFLGTAAYLIFGSWLNYTRYGARGWDLLPHGDTIRDIPYLMKDWARRVLNTVQGSGSHGGYSAV